MSTPERVRNLVVPLVADLELELYDLEFTGAVLRVVVNQPGGVGMDAITALTKAISRAIDEKDPVADGFTLEVSSPGLERNLRVPAHFEAAVGSAVSVKTIAGSGSPRRLVGTLESADESAITIAADDPAEGSSRVTYDRIERARTVFDWKPTPKPGKKPKADRARPERGPQGSTAPAAPVPPSPPTEEKVSTS